VDLVVGEAVCAVVGEDGEVDVAEGAADSRGEYVWFWLKRSELAGATDDRNFSRSAPNNPLDTRRTENRSCLAPIKLNYLITCMLGAFKTSPANKATAVSTHHDPFSKPVMVESLSIWNSHCAPAAMIWLERYRRADLSKSRRYSRADHWCIHLCHPVTMRLFALSCDGPI
jgi:hypothetical protein